MSVEIKAEEQMLHYVFNGTKVGLKFTGKAAARLCALLKAKWDSRPIEGKVELHKLHTSTQSARVIEIPGEALERFDELCHKYDVMYASLSDSQEPGVVELMVRGEDMEVINRIFEECSILEPEETCRVETVYQEREADEHEHSEPSAQSREAEEGAQQRRPQRARTEESPSAQASERSTTATTDRASLREQLKEITEGLKKNQKKQTRKRSPKSR